MRSSPRSRRATSTTRSSRRSPGTLRRQSCSTPAAASGSTSSSTPRSPTSASSSGMATRRSIWVPRRSTAEPRPFSSVTPARLLASCSSATDPSSKRRRRRTGTNNRAAVRAFLEEGAIVSKASINGLRSVEFGVADMERSIAFYENVWALSLVQRDGDAAYFRASGPEHHVVVLRPRTVPGLLRANFAAPDRAAVDELFEQISKAGGKPVAQPGAVDEPGGGYGFTFDDAEGRELRVLCGVEQHKD